MAETTEYKKWLASGVSNREVIETIQIEHPALPEIYLANYDLGFVGKLESGKDVGFSAARFYWQPAETTDRTEQTTQIQMSGLDGYVYNTIRKLTFEQRRTPMKMTYRLYFADDPTITLINPPPIWYVDSIEATLEAVVAEVTSTPLRVRRIGMYYTAREFPAIRLI